MGILGSMQRKALAVRAPGRCSWAAKPLAVARGCWPWRRRGRSAASVVADVLAAGQLFSGTEGPAGALHGASRRFVAMDWRRLLFAFVFARFFAIVCPRVWP